MGGATSASLVLMQPSFPPCTRLAPQRLAPATWHRRFPPRPGPWPMAWAFIHWRQDPAMGPWRPPWGAPFHK